MGLREYEEDLIQANLALEQAQVDLRDAKARVERETRRVKALNQVVKGLRELEPVAETPQVERLPFQELSLDEVEALLAPRGREAVRLVMKDSGRDWRPAQVVEQVKGRGWIDPDAKAPDAAIRVALRRLVDDGEIEKIDTGLYRYKDSGAATPEQAASADEGLGSANGEGVD